MFESCNGHGVLQNAPGARGIDVLRRTIDGFKLGAVLVRSGVAPTVKDDMDRNKIQVRLEPNPTGKLVGFRNSRSSYLAK